MAIEKRFIHFKRFSDFNSKKLSANEANTQYTVGVSGAIQNGAPDILYQSYVWIKDTKQQWTHGQLYDGTNLNEAGFLAGEETSDQLDDVETHTYVKYVPQTLTDEQKAQTRINIGAVSEDNFKTINGESILGSGDITISGGGGGDYLPLTGGTITGDLTLTGGTGGPGNFSAYSVGASEVYGQKVFLSDSNYFLEGSDSYLQYSDNNGDSVLTLRWEGDGTKFLSNDGTYKTISEGSSSGSGAYSEVNHGTSDTTFTITPNTFHVWDEVASLTLDLGSETSGVANEYLFQFTSGATATTLTLPDDIKWANDAPPTIESNMIYQVSILKGLASCLEFDNAVALIDNLCTYDNNKTVTFQYPVASDIIVKVAGKTVSVPTGNTSGSFSGIGEPMGSITSITPLRDNTYIYLY